MGWTRLQKITLYCAVHKCFTPRRQFTWYPKWYSNMDQFFNLWIDKRTVSWMCYKCKKTFISPGCRFHWTRLSGVQLERSGPFVRLNEKYRLVKRHFGGIEQFCPIAFAIIWRVVKYDLNRGRLFVVTFSAEQNEHESEHVETSHDENDVRVAEFERGKCHPLEI